MKDMKKGLIICSTPYQIMVGALLKLQCFDKNDIVDLIITDTFNNYNIIKERIKITNFYDAVYSANIKTLIIPKTKTEKIIKGLFFLNYKKKIECTINTPIDSYDEIYFNGEEIFTYNLISYMRNINPGTLVYRYEEGYSSYTLGKTSSEKSHKLISFREKVKGNKSTLDYNGFFVFEPNLIIHEYCYPIYKLDRKIVKLKEYKDFIETVFNTKEVAKTYNKKVIIFEESFASDGVKIDDLDLYKKIINKVGSNNVSVKLHPRNLNNRFSEFGVDVHVAEGVPWEAIVLSNDFSKYIFIALASGSVINSRLLLGNDTKAFLLYKCLSERPPVLNSDFEKFLYKFNNEYSDGLYIPESIENISFD